MIHNSKNHGRLLINPNIAHEIAAAITQLNIFRKESADGVHLYLDHLFNEKLVV